MIENALSNLVMHVIRQCLYTEGWVRHSLQEFPKIYSINVFFEESTIVFASSFVTFDTKGLSAEEDQRER